ncbi:MAG: SDR family oxidoreductase [Actinobacteria bacterium]|nr:SDR family oxidoreductase [Actinomycetota bacterium]
MIDKSVIVTGASSGLGAHIVRRLVGEGARVVAGARRVERLQALAAQLAGAAGSLVVVEADVTRAEDAGRLADTAAESFGGLDALVNNAGMEIQGAIDLLTEADFEAMLRTNVIGPFLCTKATLPYLKERGGSIVNIGSTVVPRAPRNRFGYVATKGALEAMSRALAGDLGPDNIRVNVVRPGIVPSELRGLTEEEEARTLGERVPRIQALPTVGRGMDVAAAVAFLISDEAAWITGALLDVDGGYALGVCR